MSDARPTGTQAISDDDWKYVCMVASKTQDGVTRELTELLAKLTGRTHLLPRPASARKEGA